MSLNGMSKSRLMNRNRYIVIFTIFFTACALVKQRKMNSNIYELQKTIFIGQGVGPLVVNHSIKKDVDSYLGKGKEIDVVISFRNHTTSIKKVEYPLLGIEVEYSNLDKLKKTDTLRVIRLFDPCEFETQNGIKIGTKRLDVERLLGKPEKSIYKKLIDGSVYHSLRYQGVEFEFNDTIYDQNSIMSRCVSKIIVW